MSSVQLKFEVNITAQLVRRRAGRGKQFLKTRRAFQRADGSGRRRDPMRRRVLHLGHSHKPT